MTEDRRPNIEKIWAVILAAGESKRMKVPKMLLPFNGITMIEKVIQNVLDSEVFNILVVLGCYRNEISAVIDKLPVIKCFNDDYREGMLSSVKCGLRNLPYDAEAALIFPGDQPLIEPEVTNRIIECCRQSGKGIVIPVHRNRRGHPLLFDSKYIGTVLGLDKNDMLSSFIKEHRNDVKELRVNSPGILKDFDTKEDYLNEIFQNK